jgi:hypothetical protein
VKRLRTALFWLAIGGALALTLNMYAEMMTGILSGQ